MNVKVYSKLKAEEIKSIDFIIDYCLLNNVKCYLVGGVVRDILMKEKYRDIDISIEIDPINVIKFIQQYYSSELKEYLYYKKFMTATIEFCNGVKIDLIRCRKEVYRQNGDLPNITPAGVYDDIMRRDFTINSIAYDLIDRCLLDSNCGLYDLKRGIVKKIHKNSYEEDPTRIFRAIKYAVRYDMKLEDKEEIKNLIKKNIVSNVSNDRIVKEILLLLKEKEWKEVIYKLEKIGFLKINYALLQTKTFLFKENLIEHKLILLFSSLKEISIKQIFLNNSIISKKVKKSFLVSDNQELYKKIMKAQDNYDLFCYLDKLNSYEMLALSFNSMIKYKLLNHNLNSYNNDTNLNGEMLKEKGIYEGKDIGKILNKIVRINKNTLLDLDELVLNDFIGESTYGS
ncbi:tRNA nucleotidyltransferase/poly(A) polymerase family protein [Clostridium sp. DL1XJH146]